MKLLTKPWFYIPLSIFTITLAIFSAIELVDKNKKSAPKIQADIGQIYDNKYFNDFLGWEFTIPEGYNTIPDQVRDARIKKGSGQNFDPNSSIKLLGIRNTENESITLTSNLDVRSYFPDITNSEDYFDLTKGLLSNQFQNTTTTFNLTQDKTQIEGIEFDLADIEYKKNNESFYWQKMYFRFYKEYILTITLSSDNIPDLNVLSKSLEDSKFKKKSTVHNSKYNQAGRN